MRLFPAMEDLNKFYNLISTSLISGSKWETFHIKSWNNPEGQTQETKELESNTINRKRWGDIYITQDEMWGTYLRKTYSDWSKSESTISFKKKIELTEENEFHDIESFIIPQGHGS